MVLFVKKLYNNIMSKTEIYVKKKATLMIQHLESIYTMVPPSFPVVHHGFLAVHHDEILAIGEGEGWEYVDKDTRILEGRGHLVIPGMIDVAITLPKQSHTALQGAASFCDELRIVKENCEIWMKHGTLVGNLITPMCKQDEHILHRFEPPYEFDFLQREQAIEYPVISPLEFASMIQYKRFCISSGYGNTNCLDQMLCAKLYYHAKGGDALQTLAACTLYPAQMLGLPRLGSLAKGKIANILLLEGREIGDVLSRFHGDEHMQVIKEGTRRYPNIII